MFDSLGLNVYDVIPLVTKDAAVNEDSAGGRSEKLRILHLAQIRQRFGVQGRDVESDKEFKEIVERLFELEGNIFIRKFAMRFSLSSWFRYGSFEAANTNAEPKPRA